MSGSKAPITTHILDQTTGKPAAGVLVHLTTTAFSRTTTSGGMISTSNAPGLHVTASTDADGRIGHWTEILPDESASEEDKAALAHEDPNRLITQYIHAQSEPRVWRLSFETGTYFGSGKTFWPTVELVVTIDRDDPRGHWHVPLLLGPFGYTTYRGS